MLDCGGKRCGYAESDSSSACDDSSGSDGATSEEEVDDNDDDYEREMELKKRARAQLVAERARNGVTTTAHSRLNNVVGLPPTPRLPRQQHLTNEMNVKPSLAASRPSHARPRDIDTSTKTRESQRVRVGLQEERRRR